MPEYPRVPADVSIREDHRCRAERRAWIELCRADPESAVVEQVGHQAPTAIAHGAVAEG